MSGCKGSSAGMESPMDIAFSWPATPKSAQSSGGSGSHKSKRKLEVDDSGYATPHCGYKSKSDSSTGDDTGFVSLDSSSWGKLRKECRVTPGSPIEDSYVEFLCGETSLYPEDNGVGRGADHQSLVSPRSMEVDEVERPTTRSSTCPGRLGVGSRRLSGRKWRLSEPPLPRKKTLGPVRRRLRSLGGEERLDLLYHLGVKSNQYMPVVAILDCLSGEDLASMMMVSKAWRSIVLSHPSSKAKWSEYVNERKARKENLYAFQSAVKKSTLTHLRDRNQSTPLKMSQPSSPPVSPSKVRFLLFQKEAKKLKSGETLMRCPTCSSPSVCSPGVKLGVCVRSGCRLRFCTICLRTWHEGEACDGYFSPTITTPTKSRPLAVGSKESRRNLRRL